MMSLRQRLNDMGIDGLLCEGYLEMYLAEVRADPSLRMGTFLHWVKKENKL